jgi:hypothetical protein
MVASDQCDHVPPLIADHGFACEARKMARRSGQCIRELERPMARTSFSTVGHYRGACLHPRPDPHHQGDEDQYGTLRQIEVAENECYCPVETVILKGIHHVPHREAPEATTAAIVDFARRLQLD